MRHARIVFSFIVTFLFSIAAFAQSVRWVPAETSVSNAVVLAFENCAPEEQPTLPTIPGVSFNFIGRSESTRAELGPTGFTQTRTIALNYLVRAPQNTPVQIPSFTVRTDKGTLRVPEFRLAATSGAALDSLATTRLVPERNTVWAGEVFGLNYEFSAASRRSPQISPTFDWNAAPLIAEDWAKPEISESTASGERRVHVLFRTRAIARTPGTTKLEAANHLLSIQTGTIGFGILMQPRMEQVSVTSDQPTIEVRPLPAPPAGFNGAVGEFKLVSKVVPEKAAVGEPVTWTLELSGTGNWPDIAGLPARDVSQDFQVVQPKARRTAAEGKLFDVTLIEDVVLVPTKAGTYTLGPLSFVYFDPKSGSYRTLSAPRTTVSITAPAQPTFAVTMPQPSDGETPAAGESTTVRRDPTTPTPPQTIPRDPLPGASRASAPLAPAVLVANISIPFAALGVFWAWLALGRARETDPLRERRDAHARLAQTLSHLSSAPEADRAGLLLAWQRDTAVLWQLRAAAPAPSALPDATWSTLWAEADRALYGTRAALPVDWVARAQEALAAKRVPGFRPWRLFLPQNLMPFAAMFALIGAAGATWLRAADSAASAAYAKGDFAAAEKVWRAAMQTTPTDWIARHNLSLALSQQNRTTESAAHAVAAFVQNPSHAALRWHFTHTAGRSGVVPAPLAPFVSPAPSYSLARLLSPAEWQRALIAAAWIAAAAAGTLLFNAYRRRARVVRWIGTTAIVLSAGLAGASANGVLSYGWAAKAEAAIVARTATLRSIPTEADTTQKTTSLAAGTLAVADKTFLGWTRLAFENGQTGWVRKEDIVPLWK